MTKKMLCPNCGKDEVGTYVADDSFLYGVGNPVRLIAKDVDFFRCVACELTYTGEDGERKRQQAVQDHLSTQPSSKEQIMSVVGWLTHFLGCVRTDLQRERGVTKIFQKDAEELQKALDILEKIAYPQAASAPEPRARRRPTLEESNAWASAEEERDWWRDYALDIEQSAPPPPAAPHSDRHLREFAEWLAMEMPAGTVIGNPHWWAPKLLAAACVTADEALTPPPRAIRPGAFAVVHSPGHCLHGETVRVTGLYKPTAWSIRASESADGKTFTSCAFEESALRPVPTKAGE